MDREDLIEQIESLIAVDLQADYDRSDRNLTLPDDELWEVIWNKSRSQSGQHVPPRDRERALENFRKILRQNQRDRQKHLNSAARKMLVFVNRARARRDSTGSLSIAEYREAQLLKRRKDILSRLRHLERHPPRSARSETLDNIHKEEIGLLMDVLSVLDTDVDLDEAALQAIEDKLIAIRKQAAESWLLASGFTRSQGQMGTEEPS